MFVTVKPVITDNSTDDETAMEGGTSTESNLDISPDYDFPEGESVGE